MKHTNNNMVAVGFPLYKGDYNFLKHLKEQGKVRHGELSKFMRQKFSAFVAEKAAQIKVKQTSILPCLYGVPSSAASIHQ